MLISKPFLTFNALATSQSRAVHFISSPRISISIPRTNIFCEQQCIVRTPEMKKFGVLPQYLLQGSLLPLSPSSYNLESSSTKPAASKNRQATMVYVLIVASFLSFLADNICHIPFFQSLYLYHHHSSLRWWQPLTSTFCHATRAHLRDNAFLLLLFGRSVEDEIGPGGLLFSYIFCGVAANLVSLWLLPTRTVSIGASGAVFGLFAVSILSRLSSWRDLNWRKLVEVGVLGQFVLGRFLEEARNAANGGVIGVNHVAHLAGMGAGVAMVVLIRLLIGVMEMWSTDKK